MSPNSQGTLQGTFHQEKGIQHGKIWINVYDGVKADL